VIVAATKKIPVSDIAKGVYTHLGLLHDGNALRITDSVLPHSRQIFRSQFERLGRQENGPPDDHQKL
jgi:hypothetical protein